jgi:uncharacterized protein
MRRWLFITVGMTLTMASMSCAPGAGRVHLPGVVSETPMESGRDRSPLPLVDHHQHLMSPAMARHWSEPAPPLVELPQELQATLVRREEAFGDPVRLADLYTEDAMLLDVVEGRPRFHHGREQVVSIVRGLFAQPYRIVPVSSDVDNNLAQITGYATLETGGYLRHFGHSLLSLRRESDGVWRIAAETFLFPGPGLGQVTADRLVRLLDAAGIQRAAVFSVAYGFASPRSSVDDEYERVRAENDWTFEQIARHPERLVGFCSFNPLSKYAMEELDRCGSFTNARGIKLHFGNADVDLLDPAHVEAVRRVFRAASERRLAIVVHLSRYDRPYQPAEHRIFLEQILPDGSDVPVQIAHLSGWGGFSPAIDAALDVYVSTLGEGDPRTKNLWFDATGVVHNLQVGSDAAERIATRIRQLGVSRVVFGSDMPIGDTLPPRAAWAAFRGLLPLTDDEFAIIASNVAPYMR